MAEFVLLSVSHVREIIFMVHCKHILVTLTSANPVLNIMA